MNNLFNVRQFFKELKYKDYVILRKSDLFPDYTPCSDIDILCEDINEFKDSLHLFVLKSKCSLNVILDINANRTHFNMIHNNKIDLSFDLRDKLYYTKFKVNQRHIKDIIKNAKVINIKNTIVNVPSDGYEIATRLMEYIEYPNKIKHLKYLK